MLPFWVGVWLGSAATVLVGLGVRVGVVPLVPGEGVTRAAWGRRAGGRSALAVAVRIFCQSAAPGQKSGGTN
ncbi:hypothetical protein ACFQX6_02295 [Streptosporangium lutulentum]